MAIVYQVAVNGAEAIEGSVLCATRAEAMRVRAECEFPYGEVEKITLAKLPARELAVAIYNRSGFSATSEVIAPAMKQRPRDD